MRLDDSGRRGDVEDERGLGGARRAVSLGVGAMALIVAGYWMGLDPAMIWRYLSAERPAGAPTAAASAARGAADQQADFMRAVLAETEEVWGAVFRASGRRYAAPGLVLFSGSVASVCGFAGAATGPFYCPADRTVYLDVAFFHQLATDFGAAGAFAQAYVIAHEVGHHVQTLLGEASGRASLARELQADCYAGVWAARAGTARAVLAPGDVERGLRAAATVGDDTLLRRDRGTVVPDSLTHGSAAQRIRWFRRGFAAGQVERCDTFAAGVVL
jgi:uncharacterized protein